MTARATWLSTCALLALLGCEHQTSGAAEPFRVRDAQFMEGTLPGTRSEAAEKADASGDTSDEDAAPSVTAVETFNLDVFQGQGGKAFRGRASRTAAAVLIAFEGAEQGYWVIPTGSPDPVTEELTWSAVTDFDVSLAPGKHTLRMVAVDEAGRAGLQLDLSLCVVGRVPDNHSACNADKAPPRAVISLQWDVNADLDLQVVDADGRVIDAKHPNSDGPNADAGMPATGSGMLDRDSNAACAIDGIRTENLVWNTEAPQGRYRIYVNLFDACKQPAVRFQVAVYSARDGDDAASFMKPRLVRNGELLDLSSMPTADRGLFVAECDFN